MKKMNNKGFAITTLLYGLMSVAFLIMTLLMGIMSQNRQNTSTLVDKIEEELNRYGETETTFGYLGESQEYIVPHGQAGWYKIELWGAQTTAGLGDYTSGIIYLEANATLFFFLGGTCTTTSECSSVFNNGNTEVRIEDALWTDAASQRSTFMRAAGLGTSYISGYAGSNSINASGTATKQTNHYSDRYFINGLHIPDANAGNSKANVELVSTNDRYTVPNMKTNRLSAVRYIQNCTEGSTADTSNRIVEIQAIDASTGENRAKGKTISNVSSNASYATDGLVNSANYTTLSTTCTVVDLGADYTLSEIAVWHYYSDSRAYKNHTLAVKSSSGTNYINLKNTSSSVTTSEKESIIGYHYTPWQPLPSDPIPIGNYYIMSTTSYNMALTAQNSRYLTGNNKANVTTERFEAAKLQKWTVEPVDINSTYLSDEEKATHSGKTVYKIYESENKNALQVAEGTAEIGENANAAKNYVGDLWDLWEIIPLENGTYKIKSLLGTYLSTTDNLTTEMNVILNNDNNTATNFFRRWKFINAEY